MKDSRSRDARFADGIADQRTRSCMCTLLLVGHLLGLGLNRPHHDDTRLGVGALLDDLVRLESDPAQAVDLGVEVVDVGGRRQATGVGVRREAIEIRRPSQAAKIALLGEAVELAAQVVDVGRLGETLDIALLGEAVDLAVDAGERAEHGDLLTLAVGGDDRALDLREVGLHLGLVVLDAVEIATGHGHHEGDEPDEDDGGHEREDPRDLVLDLVTTRGGHGDSGLTHRRRRLLEPSDRRRGGRREDGRLRDHRALRRGGGRRGQARQGHGRGRGAVAGRRDDGRALGGRRGRRQGRRGTRGRGGTTTDRPGDGVEGRALGGRSSVGGNRGTVSGGRHGATP